MTRRSRRMVFVAMAAGYIAACGSSAFAQTTPSTAPAKTPLAAAIEDLATSIASHGGTLDRGGDIANLARVISRKRAGDNAAGHAVAAGAANPVAVQTGAAATNGSSSTSLVTKGLVPSIFGLAVENGALTQSTSGSTVTFSGTPDGIIRALAGKGYFQTRGVDGIADFAGAFAFTASFAETSTSTGSTAASAATSNTSRLSQYSIHAELVNHRDPRRDSGDWRDLFTKVQGNVQSADDATTAASQAQASFSRLASADPKLAKWADPELNRWIDQLNAALAKKHTTDVATLETLITGQLDTLDFTVLMPDTLTASALLATSLDTLDAATARVIDAMKNNLLITAVYTEDLPATGSSVSTATLVAEKGAGASSYTLNASASLLDGSLPANVSGRWRDLKLTGQLDQQIKKATGIGALTLSVAGQLEHLHQDPSQPVSSANAGNIATLQAKLSIPLTNSLSLPVSFTIANRSELIKEHVVRGQFGFTFSFDSILAALKPGSPNGK